VVPAATMSPVGSSSVRGGLSAVVGALVAVVLVTTVLLWGGPASPSPAGPHPPQFPILPATLGGMNGSLVDLTSGFLGVNLRADAPFTASDASALNSTGVRLVRWPGGGNGDRYDPLANGDRGVIYNGGGQPSVPPTTLANFVSWCRSVACRSIITLPAEIDNASLAVSIVNYTEVALGFEPTYWEIGNEPALWQHFDIPWSSWNDSQDSVPTPDQYSALVQSYVRAIRAVDPTTGIIGIGGIGKGASQLSQWFSPTLTVNGPNLSAMAIHVYPAGSGFPSSDLTAWFGSLWGGTGLPARVTSAESALRADCPGCQLTLLVDEFQAGTGLGATTSLTGGVLATYVAAELVQSLPLPLGSMDFYDFRSTTPGAWFNTSDDSSATYALYRGLAGFFGPSAAQLNVTPPGNGLLAAVGGATPGPLTSLLLVNTNATFGLRVNVTAVFPGVAGGTAWVFNGSANMPSVYPIGQGAWQVWTIPPASLAILTGLGPTPY